MKTIEMKVIDPAGIHARPASLLVKEATKFTCDVDIEVNGKKATLKSILGVMSLGVKADETFMIHTLGDDEEIAAKAIETFLVDNKIAS